MGEQLPQRRVPVKSLKGQTKEATEALQDGLYLDELERQAVIVNNNIAFAWQRAMGQCSSTDPEVWSALQAALFAAIVVQRILSPSRVRKYAGHRTQDESQVIAERRGQRLRKLLNVPADASFLQVQRVRDPFEHVDERLDEIITTGPITLSDWYISTGLASVTPSIAANPDPSRVGHGLRVLFPVGGLLYFGEEALDLYEVDIAMLDIRQAIIAARAALREKIKGRTMFGGSQLVELVPQDRVIQRANAWLEKRAQRGQDLGVRLSLRPDDDPLEPSE